MAVHISTDAARGKTLQKIQSDYAHFVVEFTDDTYCAFDVDGDENGAFITERVSPLDMHSLRGFEMVTGEEFDKWNAAQAAVRNHENDDRERAEYERLRAKFEPAVK